jgi:ribonuclease D
VTDEALWVADEATFADVLAALADEPRYALDTEFHRERSYHPKVALVQLAWPSGIALVDPLAIDLRGIRPPSRARPAVVHAAQRTSTS